MKWNETPNAVIGMSKRPDIVHWEHQWDRENKTMTWRIKFTEGTRGRTKPDWVWVEEGVDFD